MLAELLPGLRQWCRVSNMAGPIPASIDTGSLRNRIQLQKSSYTQNASGDLTQVWTTVATLWANVEPMQTASPRAAGAFEPYAAQELQPHSYAMVTMRYYASLNVETEMRIVFGPHTYVVRSVVNVRNRNHAIQVVCEEILNNSSVDA